MTTTVDTQTPVRKYALPTEEEVITALSPKARMRYFRVLNAKNPQQVFLRLSKKKNPIFVVFLVIYGLCDYDQVSSIVEDLLEAFPEMLQDDEFYRLVERVFAAGARVPCKQTIRGFLYCDSIRHDKLSFMYPHVYKWKTGGNTAYTDDYMKAYRFLRKNNVPLPDNYIETLQKIMVWANDWSSELLLTELTGVQQPERACPLF